MALSNFPNPFTYLAGDSRRNFPSGLAEQTRVFFIIFFLFGDLLNVLLDCWFLLIFHDLNGWGFNFLIFFLDFNGCYRQGHFSRVLFSLEDDWLWRAEIHNLKTARLIFGFFALWLGLRAFGQEVLCLEHSKFQGRRSLFSDELEEVFVAVDLSHRIIADESQNNSARKMFRVTSANIFVDGVQ